MEQLESISWEQSTATAVHTGNVCSSAESNPLTPELFVRILQHTCNLVSTVGLHTQWPRAKVSF